MQINIIPSSQEKVILSFQTTDQKAQINIKKDLLPLIALSLGGGIGTVSHERISIQDGEVEIISQGEKQYFKVPKHRRLQLGMKIWLITELDEETYRKAVKYPELIIETDQMIKKQLRIRHAAEEINEEVAVIPDGQIFTSLTRNMEDNALAQYESAGIELSIRRTGSSFELFTREQGGDIEWLATPKEIQQIQEKISPTYVVTKAR